MLSKKIQRDFRVNRKGKKDLFRYEVRYWWRIKYFSDSDFISFRDRVMLKEANL
jgi:hypothetical protein